MRRLRWSGRVVKASGVAVCAVLLVILSVAPPAGAANGTVTVTPPRVVAGHTVLISGSVPTTLCPQSDQVTITSVSALFARGGFGPTVSRTGAGDFSVTFTVPASTPPGTYRILLRCGGGNVGVDAALEVIPQVAQVPGAAPQAGLGGASRPGGHPAAWAAAGALALGLAALLAFFAWRRRPVGS